MELSPDSRLDLILLGATGFTGTETAKYLALVTKEVEYQGLRWGIAGRSREKLKNLISKLKTSAVDPSKIPIFQCDVTDQESLIEVSKCTKVVMNATGPNTLLSASIVKACIQTRTDYVDISAELSHMLNIYRDFGQAAEAANVLIVPACGFATIPVVAGLIHLEQNFKGTLQAVDCYVILDIPLRAHLPCHNNSLIHYGTWASLVHELRNFKQYSQLKSETFPVKTEGQGSRKSFFHCHEGRIWYPYPGPERDIIEQTQRYRSERGKSPYQFNAYTTMPYFIHFLILVPVFFFYYWMSAFACFRKLLWSYPRVFTAGLASHEGPSENMRNDTKYSFILTAKGVNGSENGSVRTLTVKVSGNDPGYRTTAVAFVISAITLLKERSKMPKGGVVTTGVAYEDTNLLDRLKGRGIEIKMLDKSSA